MLTVHIGGSIPWGFSGGKPLDLLAFGVEGRAARNGIDDDGNSIVVEKSRPSHAVAQLPLDQIVARVQSQKSRSSNAARMKVPRSLCMGRPLLAEVAEACPGTRSGAPTKSTSRQLVTAMEAHRVLSASIALPEYGRSMDSPGQPNGLPTHIHNNNHNTTKRRHHTG